MVKWDSKPFTKFFGKRYTHAISALHFRFEFAEWNMISPALAKLQEEVAALTRETGK
jgi:hypothetical protein